MLNIATGCLVYLVIIINVLHYHSICNVSNNGNSDVQSKVCLGYKKKRGRAGVGGESCR